MRNSAREPKPGKDDICILCHEPIISSEYPTLQKRGEDHAYDYPAYGCDAYGRFYHTDCLWNSKAKKEPPSDGNH